MNQSDILQQVTSIFRDQLDNENIILTRESTVDDVEEWDSLSHIYLIVAIEKHFKVKFTTSEIQSWKNVGEMLDSIGGKL